MSFFNDPPAIARLQPELAVGGYSAYDGTVEFYTRVGLLTTPQSRVLDLGAGRGAWFEDDASDFRRQVRLLRGKVAEVVGCDVDPAVKDNRAVDTAHVIVPGQPLPLEDGSMDLVVSDYVFEHVEDPLALGKELHRVLKPGGWICARTPTKHNYVCVAARLVSNLRHASVLHWAQPGRKAEDVFPTVYRLNKQRDLDRAFPAEFFEHHSYLYCFEPQYHFGHVYMYRLLAFLHRFLPASLHGNLYIFLRKR
jgi:SAM-dependent methyltransferase